MTVPHHPLAPVCRFLVLESLQKGGHLRFDCRRQHPLGAFP
jgi:hypothetical protein